MSDGEEERKEQEWRRKREERQDREDRLDHDNDNLWKPERPES
jgi:hypothetical protein